MPVTEHFLSLLHMSFSKPTVTVHTVTGVLSCLLCGTSSFRGDVPREASGPRPPEEHLSSAAGG